MAYCQRCDRDFVSYDALNQHEDNSVWHTNHVEVCVVCDRGFWTENQLDEHLREEGHYRYLCDHPNCDRYFGNENDLREHSKVHLDRNIECPFCDKYFSLFGGLFLHLEGGWCEGNVKRPWLISVAQQMDRNRIIVSGGHCSDEDNSDLEDEVDYNYQCTGDWQCPKCPDRYFPNQHAVRQHLQSSVHSGCAFKCGSCGCGYTDLSALAQHLEIRACHWPKGMRALKSLVFGLRSGRRFTLH